METHWFTLCCCCRTLFDSETVILPPGHRYCPNCTGKACTQVEGASLLDAMKRCIAKHGDRRHDFKIWTP